MTPLMWVGLAILLIFSLGFLTGQGVETRTSMTRGKRQAARQREMNAMHRAYLDPADEPQLVAVGPRTRFIDVEQEDDD